MTPVACAPRGLLSIERILFALAATMVAVGVILTIAVSHWFAALPLFAAANMWLFSLAGDCPASLILRRVLGRSGSGSPA